MVVCVVYVRLMTITFFSRQRDCSDELEKKNSKTIETKKIFNYNFFMQMIDYNNES